MLLDPCLRQQDAGLQQVVFQLQQEATRPMQGLPKLTLTEKHVVDGGATGGNISWSGASAVPNNSSLIDV